MVRLTADREEWRRVISGLSGSQGPWVRRRRRRRKCFSLFSVESQHIILIPIWNSSACQWTVCYILNVVCILTSWCCRRWHRRRSRWRKMKKSLKTKTQILTRMKMKMPRLRRRTRTRSPRRLWTRLSGTGFLSTRTNLCGRRSKFSFGSVYLTADNGLDLKLNMWSGFDTQDGLLLSWNFDWHFGSFAATVAVILFQARSMLSFLVLYGLDFCYLFCYF